MGAINQLFTTAGTTMSAYKEAQAAELKRLEAEQTAVSLEAQAARKDLEAGVAEEKGGLAQADVMREGRRTIATQRAGYAYGGVRVDTGSTADVAADTAAWTEYERQKVQYDSELQSWGLKYDAALLRQQAAGARAEASAAARQGAGGGFISLGKGVTNNFLGGGGK